MLTLGILYNSIVGLAVIGTRLVLCASRPAIVGNWHYGAVDIHPKHLAIWYSVRTNSDLEKAKANGLEKTVQTKTRGCLTIFGYPESVISEVHIGMESRENIDNGGGDWQYFR